MLFAYFAPYDGYVIAWLDTEKYTYSELPLELLLEVTTEQWEAGQTGVWYVVDGELSNSPAV
jgi:hypothetical protein